MIFAGGWGIRHHFRAMHQRLIGTITVVSVDPSKLPVMVALTALETVMD